jgi:hypothetical protein
MTVGVDVFALDDAIDYFTRVPEVSARAARLALNGVAKRGGMRLARDAILDQIAFPKDYLTGDRLAVTQFATEKSLETVISARKRATSLARFAQGQPIGSKAKLGVRVTVGKGNATVLRDAWLVRLRKGASMSEDNYNVGLAVRLKPGERLSNKVSAHKSWLIPNAVALLYGPSVDQVFRDVAGDIAKPVADLVAAEFFRQFDRLK